MDKILGSLKDDTSKLLTDGNLVANKYAPCGEVIWHGILEHATKDHEKNWVEQLE